jgi:hypothetical protein
MRCEWPDFQVAKVRPGWVASPYTAASATSDGQQFVLVRLGTTMARPDSQSDPWYLHQSARAVAPILPP